jgi:hypothetical protein
MTTLPSENYDCRTCGACCLGFPLFDCSEDYYKKYGILYELRGLYFLQKENTYHCMTESCKYLTYKNGSYTCDIQEDKPEVCRKAKPGDKICLEARKFK